MNASRPTAKGGRRPEVPFPYLLQYVSTGKYFARVRVKGKIFRQSLDPTVFSTAKLRLGAIFSRNAGPKERPAARSPRHALNTSGESLRTIPFPLAQSDTGRIAFGALLESRPGPDQTQLSRISERDCQEWAACFRPSVDEQYFNNVLGTLRGILFLRDQFALGAFGGRSA